MIIETSIVFDKLRSSTSRITLLEGGSRSSKTWSTWQHIILKCQDAAYNKKFLKGTICRKKLTWLKATLLPDFKEIMRKYNYWDDSCYHKTDQIYNLWGNEIAFCGLDEPQKLHGRKQDFFWINEANESNSDDFDQLDMRTEQFGILDYNPSFTQHELIDKLRMNPDVNYIHSTMLDNPFLNQNIRNKILSYEPTESNYLKGTADVNKWKIYGLGVRANIEGLIFDAVTYIDKFPALSQRYIGLDFGFTNDVTAVCEVGRQDGKLYARELIYKLGMTNIEISKELAAVGIDKKKDIIVADSAELKSIAELRLLGWNVIEADKGSGSVNIGIDILKSYPIVLDAYSYNFKREQENYTWMRDKRNGQFMNKPVDNFNHLWDAFRYVAQTILVSKEVRKFRKSLAV